MHSPFDIVWGNPLTMLGWDEGVTYQELFAAGHLLAAALIGVCPLVVHAAIVCAGIAVMQKGRPENKWWFHLLYWFVVVNFMEIIAYILMRSFATSGDVGIFNRGLSLRLDRWQSFMDYMFFTGESSPVCSSYTPKRTGRCNGRFWQLLLLYCFYGEL